MTENIEIHTADSISKYIEIIEKVDFDDLQLYFRGEPEDYGQTAFQPSVYRGNNLEKEHVRYREIQRFNDSDFNGDSTTLDKLSRMQHFNLPTRLIDLSEDALTALYFAVSERKNNEKCVVYLVGIDKSKIKYYDSDTALVISNLTKLPLINSANEKSKKSLHSASKYALTKKIGIEKYNNNYKSVSYLLHEIKEDKSHLQPFIDPKHIFSIQCVKPKLSNKRIYGQKGAFLIFGMNSEDINKSIPVVELDAVSKELVLHKHIMHESPINKIVKIIIEPTINVENLEKIGITRPYIYTGLEKISEYLKGI